MHVGYEFWIYQLSFSFLLRTPWKLECHSRVEMQTSLASATSQCSENSLPPLESQNNTQQCPLVPSNASKTARQKIFFHCISRACTNDPFGHSSTHQFLHCISKGMGMKYDKNSETEGSQLKDRTRDIEMSCSKTQHSLHQIKSYKIKLCLATCTSMRETHHRFQLHHSMPKSK